MRLDLKLVDSWISPGARVLDLGCGDGTLLAALMREKQVSGYGVEINPDNMLACVEKGVSVIEQNLDAGLTNFADASFDTVIMSQTLQTMRYPAKVLAEMARVGRECIVTIPNFGHWRARWQLLVKGRMPVSDLLPYQWYDTPNIHFCTFTDFADLCARLDLRIVDQQVITELSWGAALKDVAPNMFGETGVFRVCR